MTTSKTIGTTMTAGLALAMLAAGLSSADARGFGGGGFGGGRGFNGGFVGRMPGIAVGEPRPGGFGDHGGDRSRATLILGRADDGQFERMRALRRYECLHRGGHAHYCP